MRFLSIPVGFIFFIFMVLQWNDPDAFTWMMVYFYAGSMSAVYRLQSFMPPVYWGSSLLYFAASGMIIAESTFDLQDEAFRESMGLLICAIWFSALGWNRWALDKKEARLQKRRREEALKD